jgi:hypothetical protein
MAFMVHLRSTARKCHNSLMQYVGHSFKWGGHFLPSHTSQQITELKPSTFTQEDLHVQWFILVLSYIYISLCLSKISNPKGGASFLPMCRNYITFVEANLCYMPIKKLYSKGQDLYNLHYNYI